MQKIGSMRSGMHWPFGLCMLATLGFQPAVAAVQDITVTDVTTRALSVVWASDEPILDATVRVFSDADGVTEITGSVDILLDSPVAAMDLGIAKVTVTGLSADTPYFVRTETTTASGVTVEPGDTLIGAVTNVVTTKANDLGEPIVNDLIRQDILAPDGTSVADGALLMVTIPSVSANPVTAFVGQGFTSPAAAVDLNNIFEDASGTSADLVGGELMEVAEFRGLACSALTDHTLLRRRLVPEHEEAPPITELESPADCFSPSGISVDHNCDGRVGFGDLNLLSAKFGTQQPECGFNSDFDENNDGRIGFGDINLLSSVFGLSE